MRTDPYDYGQWWAVDLRLCEADESMPGPAASARDLLFVLCVFAVLAVDTRRHRVYIRVVLTRDALEASHRTCAPRVATYDV